MYSSYKGSYKPAVQLAAQAPIHDPLPTASAMLHATNHLGLVYTNSTTYVPPYYLARQLSTLDHLSKGRIGWNVVTSYGEAEAKNYGLEEVIPHDERYDIADEYM